MALYYSDTHLIGKVSGQITSSGTIQGLGAKGTIWYDKGQNSDGIWVYSTDKTYEIPVPVVPVPLYGINLSGGEFNGVENGALIPSASLMQAYYDVGFRLFRVPFIAGQINRPDALAKIVALVNKAIELNTPIVLDRHEYKWPAPADQIAFWVKVHSLLPKTDLLQFDLMNEPKGFNDEVLVNQWEQWARDSRIIVHGLRDAGITNFIWLEYPSYSGISRFNKNETGGKIESAAAGLKSQGNIEDPLGKTGIQAHAYFDSDGSGTSGYCDSDKTSSNFIKFANQVAAFGMPAMIGESAFGKTGGCEALAEKTLTEMAAGINNLFGVTWWGGGRGWKTDYTFYTPADPTSTYVTRLTGQKTNA